MRTTTSWRFYRAFPAGRCQPSHISLFRRDGGAGDLAAHLRAQDLIYVGGGSVISLLGTWSAHGVDGQLRAAWEAGVVMAGLSAGSLCWFEQGITAFHGESAPVAPLGCLPHSNAVDYDDKPERRAAFLTAVADGMVCGYGTGDGAALHFVGTDLVEVVTSRPKARAFAVTGEDGSPSWPRATWSGRLPLPDGRRTPTILAMGGGGFTAGAGDPALDELVLRLTGRPRPRVCLRPPRAATLSTRSAGSTRPTRTGCASRVTFHCSGSAVSRYHSGSTYCHRMRSTCGGGSMVNLLAIWKAQGLDVILREAWEAGVLLAGLSAGSMCGSSGASARPTATPHRRPGSASCPARTPSTTTASPRAAPVYSRRCAAARSRRAVRSTTAPR